MLGPLYFDAFQYFVAFAVKYWKVLNSFTMNVQFPHPPKTTENLSFSKVFRG